MAKLWLLVFVWGPALAGFSLGCVVRHPDDWTGPAVMGPIGLVLTAVTFTLGWRRLRVRPDQRLDLSVGMIASLALGAVLFVMQAAGFLG